jgi:hypothetical protein
MTDITQANDQASGRPMGSSKAYPFLLVLGGGPTESQPVATTALVLMGQIVAATALRAWRVASKDTSCRQPHICLSPSMPLVANRGMWTTCTCALVAVRRSISMDVADGA